jgi:hypothetical protein
MGFIKLITLHLKLKEELLQLALLLLVFLGYLILRVLGKAFLNYSQKPGRTMILIEVLSPMPIE